MTTKHCRYCNMDLDVSEFAVRKASPDGLGYKCRSCSKKYAKERYATIETCSIAAKKRAKEWAKANREKRRIICSKHYYRNIESERTRKANCAKQKRIDDPEHCRALGRIAAYKRRERSEKHMAKPCPGLIRRIITKANGFCMYCGSTSQPITIDHFHPVSKGGNGQASNLVPCCGSCNSSKKDRDGPEWIERVFGISRLIEVFWKLERFSSVRLP